MPGKERARANAQNNKERIRTMKTNLTLLTTLLPTPWTSDRIVAMQRAALMLFAIGANVYALAFLRCAFANNQEDAVTGLSAAQTVEFQDCTINGQAVPSREPSLLPAHRLKRISGCPRSLYAVLALKSCGEFQSDGARLDGKDP